MPFNLNIGPYDPCPCGSGEKYKFCCAAKNKSNRHGRFPMGTVVFYGPDDKTTTKIAAAVIKSERDLDIGDEWADSNESLLKRWVGTDVAHDPKVAQEIKHFFATHGVKSVVVSDRNMGCPHEEGPDFPRGQDCPFCPFWAGKQGSARRDDRNDPDDPFSGEDDDANAPDEADEHLMDHNDDEDDDAHESDYDSDPVFARIDGILGNRELDREQALQILLAHLRANLTLPCEVTGIEDFRWEEPYLLGGWSPGEYRKLKKTQPSYTDRYQLLAIDLESRSPWMLFFDEDIAAHVRRVSDGKEFVLGLAELKATDRHSPNHQLLDDYAVWFVNTR